MNNIYVTSKEIKEDLYKKEYTVSKDETLNYILFINSSGNYNIDLKFYLENEGAVGYIYIAEKGIQDQKVNLSVEVIHKKQNTQAKIFVRRVMYNDSSSFVNGIIKIEKGAQNSNDYFDEKTLLLGDRVVSKVVPSLEIIPDNVKASHSSSVSMPNLKEIFYLESRGIDQKSAINLISHGFLVSKIFNMNNSNVKEKALNEIEEDFI